MTDQIGKFLIITGGVLLISGVILIMLNRFINISEFPGTIRIESGNFKIFIPIFASIVVSILLTIILNLVIRLINR